MLMPILRSPSDIIAHVPVRLQRRRRRERWHLLLTFGASAVLVLVLAWLCGCL
jgi:hypothetical protein